MVVYRSREFSFQNQFALLAVVAGAVAMVAVLTAADAWAQAGVVGGVVVAALALLLLVPLTITVEDAGRDVTDSDAVLHVSLGGLLRRTIALADVSRVERRQYRPLRDFGGWGWRQAWKRPAVAYTTRGSSAVVLRLRNGSEVYLGVADEDALVKALRPRIFR